MFEEAVASYENAGGDTRFNDPLALHFAGVPVRDILAGHVQDAARAIYPTHKPATQNRQGITPASAILNHAAGLGWCALIRVKRFPEERAPRRASTPDWRAAFMAEASPEIGALHQFMFTTGARISEALSLRWDDLGERKAHVRRTKAGKPHDFTPSLEALVLMRSLPRDGNRVFRWQSKSYVNKLWNATCSRAGIDWLTPHEAGRHSFATEMIVRNRVDPVTTAKLGGWASTRMLDRYAHPEGLEDVVDEVFAAPKPKARKVE